MDTRNAMRILYKTPILNEKTRVLQLYKHLIHCAIVFPVFLNAKYLISNYLLHRNAH